MDMNIVLLRIKGSANKSIISRRNSLYTEIWNSKTKENDLCMHDFTKASPAKLNILSQEDLAIAVHQKFACSKVFSFVSKIVDELAKGL